MQCLEDTNDEVKSAPRIRTRGSLAVLLVMLAACASVPPVGQGANQIATTDDPAEIHWPQSYQPEDATFFVHNETEVLAPPEVVWDILVQAEAWPTWYEGAQDVKVRSSRGRLHEAASFTWTTMGLDFTSTVEEWHPPTRLSWESRKRSIKGYHAWLLVPTETGCRLVTDEAQFGFLAFMQKIFIPNKLHRLHDVWLAEIKRKAEAAHARDATGPGKAGPLAAGQEGTP
ncbi:MAG: SRPBCC domain-containing protein [Myxococcales bacterium]|nr:SRPBCC domain-containing protein [Myxococcales bacterium]